MNDIIRVRDLSTGYDHAEVLRGLEFSIPESKITAVVGTSGCGKTTLLKTLAGLIPPLAGEVIFAGNTVDYRSEASLRALYKDIGVLYQEGALLNNLTLYENVALPVMMLQPDMPRTLLREMVYDRLSQVGLVAAASKSPSELSGGMRKRGALARALIRDPRVVFCDEPSGGLDPITAGRLDDLLIDLRENIKTTFVVVTHELRSIARIADRVLVLHDGRLLLDGTYGETVASDDPFIRTFFLRKAEL